VVAQVNNELPHWLHIGGGYRARVESFLNRSFVDGQDDKHVVTRFRFDLQVQPASWMKFVFQGQDARIFGNRFVPNAPPHSNPMDLRLGYLELVGCP
jgi:hypothetical protein